MKIIAKLLFSLLVGLMLLGTLYNFGLFHELKEKTETISKQGLRHFLTIKDKLDSLEEVKDVFREFNEYFEADEETSVPTEEMTEVSTDKSDSLPVFEETHPISSETESIDSAWTPTEETTGTPETLPIEPEILPSETEALPSEAPTSYIIRAHEGTIGVFDNDGDLLSTVNVALMTLPEADRVALESGIVVESMEEVQEILDKLV